MTLALTCLAFKKLLMFSICLKGILDSFTRFTLPGDMQFTSLHSRTPLRKASPNGPAHGSFVIVSIHPCAIYSSLICITKLGL